MRKRDKFYLSHVEFKGHSCGFRDSDVGVTFVEALSEVMGTNSSLGKMRVQNQKRVEDSSGDYYSEIRKRNQLMQGSGQRQEN